MSMMRPLICAASGALAALGLPRLLHKLAFRDQLAILTYHGVVEAPLKIPNWCFIDSNSFRDQIKYLKSYFTVLPLSQAIGHLKEGRIDRPTVAITFDDGFQNNYTVAFPILQEAGLPAMIFLTTGLVNTDDTVWFCRLNRALGDTDKHDLDWHGVSLDLSTTLGRASAAKKIQNQLKELSPSDLKRGLREILFRLGDDPERPIESDSPYRMLNRESIIKMKDSGLIEFGAHTHSHAILSRLSERDQRDEIEKSVVAVTEITNRPCRFFAYPNGMNPDYNKQSVSILETSGIQAAVTSEVGPNYKDSSLMELRRYGVGPNDTIGEFQMNVHHMRHHIKVYFLLHPSNLKTQPYSFNMVATRKTRTNGD